MKKSRLSLAISVAFGKFDTSPSNPFQQGKGSPATEEPGLDIDNGMNPDGGGGQGGISSIQAPDIDLHAARGQMQQLTARLRQVGEGTSNPDASTQPPGQQ